MTETYKIKLKGKVQKKNLRKNILNIFLNLKINGEIENKKDGSVEIFLQKENKIEEDFFLNLKKYLEIHKIEVTDFSWQEIKLDKKFGNFKINYKNFLDRILSNFHEKILLFFRKKENIFLPKHIAIIPDGNRRYAKKKKKNLDFVFSNIFKSFDEIFSFIESKFFFEDFYFTLWVFSTENWKRSDDEIKSVMKTIFKFIDFLEKRNSSFVFHTIGREDRIDKKLLEKINSLKEKTKNNKTKINFVLALDYGGIDEALRSVNKILNSDHKKVDEKILLENLDNKNIPDIDLLIRTSGEKRLSGFMPLKSLYAEIYFIKKLFPEFKLKDFKKAVKNFNKRERRFGK